MARLKFVNNVEVTKRVDDTTMKCQQLCKFFREQVVQISLKTMGEVFEVLPATLSAWENGKSKNSEFIFMYYDIIADKDFKRIFIEALFDSDNQNVKITVKKKLQNDIAKGFYAVVGIQITKYEKEENQIGGKLWLTTENMM